MARKGKIVQKKVNYKQNIDTAAQSNNKETDMDDRFNDVLKVDTVNTSSDLYKRYIELKQESNLEEPTEDIINEEYRNTSIGCNSSFYSALKPVVPKEEKEEEIKEDEVIDKSEIVSEEQPMLFDLFNLNIKDSTEENLYEEKKLGNKQTIINDKNKVETVPVNKEPDYSFHKGEDINYQDTFKGLRQKKDNVTSRGKFDFTYDNNSPVTTVDLKNKLYAQGYKVRTYQKVDSENFYSMKYYLSNKLNRDCSIITAVAMMIIVGIMWLAFDSYVNLPVGTYIAIMASFLLLPVVGCIMYFSSPKSRKPATFSFKLAILNSIMTYLLGIVVCLLVAFFAVGADISDIGTMVKPLFYPMFVMLVLPIYVVVYQLLYLTKKYFIE